MSGLERRFDLGELEVEFPQHGGILARQVRPQQIVPVAEFGLLQLVFVQLEREGLARDGFALLGEENADKAEGPPRLLLGRTDPEQQLIARRRFPAQVAQFPQQPHQLTTADGLLFGPPPGALRQHV